MHSPPLADSTNTSECPLSILAGLASNCAPPAPPLPPKPTALADVKTLDHLKGHSASLLRCVTLPGEVALPGGDNTPVSAPARRSNDEEGFSSSRSSSPAMGRGFMCRACGKEYASTDAVRKHARQNHLEWLRERGVGDPNLYSLELEHAPASAPLRLAPQAPQRGGAPTHTLLSPHTLAEAAGGTPAARPHESDQSLMTAAESCLALFAAANAAAMISAAGAEADSAKRARAIAASGTPATHLPTVFAPRLDPVHGRSDGGMLLGGGMEPRPKRPRSVRCGKCEGCRRDDCGECKNCVDKPKFGGLGQRKQGCVMKLCRAQRPL